MNTRSRSRSKRNRTESDLNNTVTNIDPKRTKMINSGNPTDIGNGQIRDLSGSIISRPGPSNGVPVPPSTSEAMQQGPNNTSNAEAAGLMPANRSFEETMKAMIGNELRDVRRTVESLARTVRDLSNMVIQDRAPAMALQRTEANDNSSVGGNTGVDTRNDASSTSSTNRPRFTMPSANSNNSFPNSINNEQIKIRVDKFGINFDGNLQRLTVEEFIFRLECLQTQYGIPWEEVLRDFRLLVSGPALEWFWYAQRLKNFSSWSHLREALMCQYRTTKSTFEAMRELVDRKQVVNEPIDVYFHNMAQLRARLVQPISDLDMVNILKVNVKENIKVIVYPMSISTVEMLRTECKEAERNFPRREQRPIQMNSRPARHVNEMYVGEYGRLETDFQPDVEEVAAIRFNQQQQTRQLVCWNCREGGHVFMDCPSSERALFCYRCGKPNTITPKCPNCQQGNHRRGVEKIGEPRPSENPGK